MNTSGFKLVVVLCGALLLVGCATAPETSSYNPPSDPSEMNAYELHHADRWFCYRFTRDEERVDTFPKKARVSRVDNPVAEAWTCQGLVDYEQTSFKADVDGEPIPERDLMGSGLIGAQIEEKEGQFVVSSITKGGAADATGNIQEGERLLAIAELAGEEPVPATGLSLFQVISKIRGNPGTDVELVLLREGEYETRNVTITRERFSEEQITNLEAQQKNNQRQAAQDAVASLIIDGTGGQYMSPYTSDGVTAEWVNKAINANIGATVGSGAGAAAGAYAANKALDSVPFGGLIGGMIGSSVGESVGRETAIEASGGWQYIRSTSDQSFRSLSDMASYLKAVYGSEPTFADAMAATAQVYPDFADALASN